MKLEKYVDKSKKKRKVILISLGVIVLISVSLILYKTFAIFSEKVEFPMMNGQVDYFGNSDVYFAFYNDDVKLEEMPLKDNNDNLVFDHGECDNGAYIIWENDVWAPLVKNLNKSKTKCSLYFRKKQSIELCNKYGNDSALCYISKLSDNNYNDLAYDNTIDKNLRYIGVKPNNYILFNGEKWRIIGIMNNIEDKSNEKNSYLKIIRDSIGMYSWDSSLENVNDGNGVNEWSESDIKNVLNTNYLYSESGGECFGGINNLIKECPNWENIGIKSNVTDLISEVKWNTGTVDVDNWYDRINPLYMYNGERSSVVKNFCTGTSICNDNVERTTSWIGKIGLMYPSDFGFSIGNSISEGRYSCLEKSMYSHEEIECYKNTWLFSGLYQWTMTPFPETNTRLFYIDDKSKIDYWRHTVTAISIRPVLYLKPTVKIISDSSENYGSIDNPFKISL